jgi:putative transposase
MSREGNCYDNAVMESFFHALKTEHVYHYRYRTRAVSRTKRV